MVEKAALKQVPQGVVDTELGPGGQVQGVEGVDGDAGFGAATGLQAGKVESDHVTGTSQAPNHRPAGQSLFSLRRLFPRTCKPSKSWR